MGERDLGEMPTAICLVTGYYHAWEDSAITIIVSEKSFNLPIINPETGKALRPAIVGRG